MASTDPRSVGSAAPDQDPGPGYVYIDWGPEFYARHSASYPDYPGPALTANIGWLGVQLMLANGGSCFLPIRMARSLISSGQLFQVKSAPEFPHPAYMVFPREADSDVLQQAIEGLRELAQEEQARQP